MEYGDELYISGSNNGGLGGVIDRDLFCRPIDFDYPLIDLLHSREKID